MTSALPLPLVLRAYGEDEWPTVNALITRAFLGDPLDEDLRTAESHIMEWDRAWGVFDGARAVGSIALFSLEMALPGGVRRVAGLSQVAVASTHRRRGILRAMMTSTLEGLHDGGEAVSALWASESAIYGRFGFGLAARSVHATLPRAAVLSAAAPSSVGDLDVVELPAGVERLALIHRQTVPTRIGDFTRSDRWWGHRTFDPPAHRGGAAPLFAVVHSTDGVDDGYAILQLKESWGAHGSQGSVNVREVIATHPGAELTLWRYLLDIDLTATVTAPALAPDGGLVTALVDARRATLALADNVYVRMVDVPRALSERALRTDVDLVLEVRDEVLPANTGRWRVRPGSTVATSEPADLALDVRELGAVHLGGTTWSGLARAGLVVERTPGSVLAAADAWALPDGLAAPVCPMVF